MLLKSSLNWCVEKSIRAAGEGKKGNNMAKELYVGHISDNASEEDVRKLFSVMGTVTSVHMIIDPETREFKHCGYVRMSGVDLGEVAEALDGALLIDRVITVSIARPQKPGMSKTKRGGTFGGPRKPGFAPKAGAESRGGVGSKSQRTAERHAGEGPISGGAKRTAGPTGASRPAARDQKTSHPPKTGGAPRRRTSRTK